MIDTQTIQSKLSDNIMDQTIERIASQFTVMTAAVDNLQIQLGTNEAAQVQRNQGTKKTQISCNLQYTENRRSEQTAMEEQEASRKKSEDVAQH